MKKNKLKRQKRSIVPLCYQKRNLSKSYNNSLSQLLSIGAYKKRINELVRNNRDLATAYTEARCEITQQKGLLKDYARDCNQTLLARFKLNEMAKTITKLVTDLDEVRNILKDNRASDKDFLLPIKRSSNDRMKIRKASPMDCIDEQSVVASEASPAECVTEDIPELMVTPDNGIFNKAFSTIGNTEQPPEPVSSKCDRNVEISDDQPPLLFLHESEDVHKERLPSKNKQSSKKNSVNQQSLTPELDIDLPCYENKRSSSRRQTCFITPRLSSRKSSRKSIFDTNFSATYVTPKRGSLSPKLRALSSAFKDSEHNVNEDKIPEISFMGTTKKGDEKSEESQQDYQLLDNDEVIDCSFVNVKLRGSKNLNDLPPDSFMSSLSVSDLINPPTIPVSIPISATSNVDSNHTILMCEDMELTEVLRPTAQNISENCSNARITDKNHAEVIYTVEKKIPESSSVTIGESCKSKLTSKNEFLENKKIHNKENLLKPTKYSKGKAVTKQDICLSDQQDDNHELVENKTPERKKTINCIESLTQSPSAPQDCTRSSRKRKPVKYNLYFSSSDESDIDSTEPTVKKIKRDTAIFKPKVSKKNLGLAQSIKKTVKSPLKEQNLNEESQNLLAIYDLDVSNSKKVVKKSKAKPKDKKSHKKDISKPISQNCCVKKLKGIDYKFSKNDKSPNNLKNQQLQIEPLSPGNSTGSSNNILKIKQTNLPDNKTEGIINCRTDNTESDNSNWDECFTPRKSEQNSIRTPKSDIKRVSFAATDLVCNFTKKSLCGTIAANKKFHRTSKSLSAFQEFPKLLDTNQATLFETEDSSENLTEASPDLKEQFNFSDETELYTFALPSNALQSIASPVKNASPKPIISIDTKSSKIRDDHHNTNSKRSQQTVRNKLITSSVKTTSPKTVVSSYSISTKIDDDHHDTNSKKSRKTLKNKLITLPVKNTAPKTIVSTNTVSAKINDDDDTNSKKSQQSVKNKLITSPVKNTSPKTIVSTNTISAKVHDDHHETNSEKSQQTVKEKSGKLSLKGKKIPQRKLHLPTSGNYEIDVLSLSLSNSPAALSVCKSSSEKLSCNNVERNIKQADLHVVNISLQPKSKQTLLCPASDSNKQISYDDLKTSVQGDSLSEKFKSLQPSQPIITKRSKSRKSNSSAVLKDLVNLSDDDEVPKRRSKKMISYKEPSLNKKMRRN